MKLKIETKKVVNNFSGKKERKVLKIEALDLETLPDEYIEKYPHIFTVQLDNKVRLIVELSATENFALAESGIYPEGLFQKLMGIVRQSGDRLHEINLRHKALRAEWNGKEYFEV